MVWIAGLSSTGSTGQVSFSSIPQTFSHLQLRVFARYASVSSGQPSGLSLNGDTAANKYNGHSLNGNGTSASSGASGFYNLAFQFPFIPGTNSIANAFGVTILDILDYSNTSKNKTLRSIGGFDDNNTSGTASIIGLYSDVWLDTSAVTSIQYNFQGNTFAAGSRFDLYGITTSSVTGA